MAFFVFFPQGPSYAQSKNNVRLDSDDFFMGLYLGSGQTSLTLNHLTETKSNFVGTEAMTALHLGISPMEEVTFHFGIQYNRSIEIESSNHEQNNAVFAGTFLVIGFQYYLPYQMYILSELRLFGDASIVYENSTRKEKTEKIFKDATGYSLGFGRVWYTSSQWIFGIGFIFASDQFDGDRTIEVKENGVDGKNNFDNLIKNSIGIFFTAIY